MSGPSLRVWMPLYMESFLRLTRNLSAAECGAYLRLLLDEWVTGPLPSDPELLRRIAAVEKHAWPAVWRALRSLFEQNGTGGLIAPGLEIERQALSRSGGSE